MPPIGTDETDERVPVPKAKREVREAGVEMTAAAAAVGEEAGEVMEGEEAEEEHMVREATETVLEAEVGADLMQAEPAGLAKQTVRREATKEREDDPHREVSAEVGRWIMRKVTMMSSSEAESPRLSSA